MYDEDYFERGVESGISGYSNYRWMPELTIPMAHELIKILRLEEGDRVLDFGCAKGFLVRALRLLYIDAYGYDISSYALGAAPNDVRPYLVDKWNQERWKCIIAKDVLEHLTKEQLGQFLRSAHSACEYLFVVTPLGDGVKYHVPSYENDVTHVIREPINWWRVQLMNAGFTVGSRFRWGHIKDNYKDHEEGNGFFLARRLC